MPFVLESTPGERLDRALGVSPRRRPAGRRVTFSISLSSADTSAPAPSVANRRRTGGGTSDEYSIFAVSGSESDFLSLYALADRGAQSVAVRLEHRRVGAVLVLRQDVRRRADWSGAMESSFVFGARSAAPIEVGARLGIFAAASSETSYADLVVVASGVLHERQRLRGGLRVAVLGDDGEHRARPGVGLLRRATQTCSAEIAGGASDVRSPWHGSL